MRSPQTLSAVGLAHREQPKATEEEIRWQVDHMSPAVRSALRPGGENRSGPLGPGLLASAPVGAIIRDLQARLADTSPP